MNKRILGVLSVATFGLIFFYSVSAYAAPMDTNVFDKILSRYQNAASAWGTVMVEYATWLFWGLVLISMVWTYGMMILRKADIQEFFAETVRFFGVTGFFWWILVNGPAIGDTIIKSMWQIGSKAIGIKTEFTPGGVVQIGFDIFFKVLDQSSIWSPVDSAMGILISIVILFVLTLIGINLLLLFISAWILIYGGVFFLGFGGSRWTSDIAISFYKTVLSVGAQLMAMLLLIGIGKTFIDQYYADMGGGANLKELGIMFVASIMLFFLTNKIPPLIGSIIDNGNFGGAGLSGNFTGGAVGMAAAAAATGGAMALTGATNIVGGGSSTLQTAFQSAQQMAGGSGILSGGSSGGGGGTGGSSGFASAMASSGGFTADVSTKSAQQGTAPNPQPSQHAQNLMANAGSDNNSTGSSSVQQQTDVSANAPPVVSQAKPLVTGMNEEAAAFVNKN